MLTQCLSVGRKWCELAFFLTPCGGPHTCSSVQSLRLHVWVSQIVQSAVTAAVGDDAMDDGALLRPIRRGVVEDWEMLESIYHYILYEQAGNNDIFCHYMRYQLCSCLVPMLAPT